MSAHSGDENEYFPSMMFRNMTICFLCQNGGHPTNLKRQVSSLACRLPCDTHNVYMITPQAHMSTSNEYPGASSIMLQRSVSGAR
jgi:hypothetical protein